MWPYFIETFQLQNDLWIRNGELFKDSEGLFLLIQTPSYTYTREKQFQTVQSNAKKF